MLLVTKTNNPRHKNKNGGKIKNKQDACLLIVIMIILKAIQFLLGLIVETKENLTTFIYSLYQDRCQM